MERLVGMKVVNVILVILFAAATSQAQIPLFPYLYPQPYIYSASSPFSQPYSGPFYFLSPSSAPMQFAAQYSYLMNDSRRDSTSPQEMQLRSQVEQLQNELTTARAQQTPVASRPQPPVTPVVLIFTNGQRVETTGYAIRDG